MILLPVFVLFCFSPHSAQSILFCRSPVTRLPELSFCKVGANAPVKHRSDGNCPSNSAGLPECPNQRRSLGSQLRRAARRPGMRSLQGAPGCRAAPRPSSIARRGRGRPRAPLGSERGVPRPQPPRQRLSAHPQPRPLPPDAAHASAEPARPEERSEQVAISPELRHGSPRQQLPHAPPAADPLLLPE